jgi:hypothetical protein
MKFWSYMDYIENKIYLCIRSKMSNVKGMKNEINNIKELDTKINEMLQNSSSIRDKMRETKNSSSIRLQNYITYNGYEQEYACLYMSRLTQ